MGYENRIAHYSALVALSASLGLSACSAGNEPSAPGGDTGSAAAVPAAAAPGAPARSSAVLATTSPGATALRGHSRLYRTTGFTANGATPDAAAESFRKKHATALGVDRAELVPVTLDRFGRRAGAVAKKNAPGNAASNGVGLMFDRATGKHKFRLYTYEQQRDGVPVFRAGLRTLVREGGDNPVVWSSADLRPMGNFSAKAAPPLRAADLQKSLRALRTNSAVTKGLPIPTSLKDVSAPTATIFAGVDGQLAAPRMAMQYTARAADGSGKWTFVADAVTGDILHVESNLHFNISGTVQGEVITGPESQECGQLGTAPLAHAEVTSSAGNAIADASGAFTIVQSGSAAVSVQSSVGGAFFDVDDGGSSDTISLNVTPPGPANFLHQDTQVPKERILAQLTAYKKANDLRDLVLSYVPEYPVVSTQTDFQIYVNRPTEDITCDRTGGAWYDDDISPPTLNFCERTAERANTAFGSIVQHEYGHHLIGAAGSGQGEYGEGMADTIAMLFSKDPRIGVGYYPSQCSNPLRTIGNTCQYDAETCSSCGGGLYECGSLISATVWDIWQQLDVSEPANSDDIIRSLVFSSIPLHIGTKIDPSIAVDFLTLDDDDDLLENGTPHYNEICTGFALHGMSCPAIVDGFVLKGADFQAEGPSDGPFEPTSFTYKLYNLGPQQSISYSVTVPAGSPWLTVSSTSGTIPIDGQVPVTVTIDQAQAALLADGRYSATLQFTAGGTTVNRTVSLRVGAPQPIYTATFASGLDGFTVDSEFQNLWHRSAACLDSLPGHSAPGFLYYGKDANCGYDTGTPLLHTVTSPAIPIARPELAELGFKYILKTEMSSQADSAAVLISVDNGPFQLVASNNQGGQLLQETGSWKELRLEIGDLLPTTATSIRVQFTFNALTIYDNLTAGFAVDDVTVYALPECTSNSQCDDGDACTTDTCSNNVCAHSDNGSCNQGPCAGICANPVQFTIGTNGYQSGNLGSNATCHETTSALHGGTCGNFVSPRALSVNGVPQTCNWNNWSSLPSPVRGGYCITTTSGNNPWASFSLW